jgi:hypothetical protein
MNPQGITVVLTPVEAVAQCHDCLISATTRCSITASGPLLKQARLTGQTCWLQVTNSSKERVQKVLVTLTQKVVMSQFLETDKEMRVVHFEHAYPAMQAFKVPITIPATAAAGPCHGKVS